MTALTTTQYSIYDDVTQSLIKKLEQGVRPWQPRWDTPHMIMAPKRVNGDLYQGVNVLLLWMASMGKGFICDTWMTYKQAIALGGVIHKGTKGTRIVYSDTMVKEREDGSEQRISFLKSYAVFNATEIHNLPEQYRFNYDCEQDKRKRINTPRQEMVDFVLNAKTKLCHGGAEAFYRPRTDEVHMPIIDDFHGVEEYYATLLHEMIHWTGHPGRLNRNLKGRFGTQSYAFEELVAELGAAFMCAQLGISPSVRDDHASYLEHWLTVLQQDNRAIFKAATLAQQACNHMMQLQPQQEVKYEKAS